MQFCKLHNIGLSTSYLKECAKSNDWLQFIIQTQLYSYQPDEVSYLCMILNEDRVYHEYSLSVMFKIKGRGRKKWILLTRGNRIVERT